MSVVTNMAAYVNGRIRGHYVYLLVCGDSNGVYIKIGHTCDPVGRLDNIRTGCAVPPNTMGIIHVFSKSEAIKLEKALHDKMNNWHSHGEWVALDYKDRAEFRIKLQTVLKAHSRKYWPLKVVTVDVGSFPDRRGLRKFALRSRNLYIDPQSQKVSV